MRESLRLALTPIAFRAATAVAVVGAILPTPSRAEAAEAATAVAGTPVAAATEQAQRPTEIVVIGSKTAQSDLVGAGTYIDSEEFRIRAYDDVNRALRQAPGVYVREEDGYGLFPNISLRGVDSQRTSKLTVMEDGIPIAPAPYSAPSAYYTPTTGRMSAIEVLKGSSQVRFGPHTTGGVLNYRSTPIPEGFAGHLGLRWGSDNDLRQHLWVGTSGSGDLGRAGFMAEYYFRHTDGFKDIDLASDDSGFRKSEPVFKLFWEPPTRRYQRFEAKLAFSDLDADESYLGLTDADFDRDPDRRYGASRFDNIDTNQMTSYLRSITEIGGGLTVTNTAFYNTFKRNWFKLRGSGRDLESKITVWRDGAPGTLAYRNNRREYYAAGVETVFDWNAALGPSEHDVRFGARFVQDRVERNQNNVDFTQAAGGVIVDETDKGGCSGGCRWQKTRALALFVEDRIEIGDFTLSPGVRFERLGQSYDDRTDALDRRRGVLTVWTPGLGVRWQVDPTLALFGGVYRGASTPAPRDHIRSGLREETSIGTELGARWTPTGWFDAEFALFHTNFNDLIVIDNLGSGGAALSENAGDVISRGVELALQADLGEWQGWGFGNPWHLTLTLTDAKLDGDARSRNTESLFAGGRDGAKVPYVPDYQVSAGTGLEFERFTFLVDANWIDKTYTTALNDSDPINGAGQADFRFGSTDSYVVVDLSASYRLSDRTSFTFNVHNLFDEEYIVSRHPIGPRPGRPRQVLLGVDFDF